MYQTVHFTDVFRQCTCSSTQVQKYQKRISGPLLDRIDIQIEVPRVSEDELLQSRPAKISRDIRAHVKRARRSGRKVQVATRRCRSTGGSVATSPPRRCGCRSDTEAEEGTG